MHVQTAQLRLNDLLTILVQSVQAGQPTAYCRVVETKGSTPQKAGALMLVRHDGLQFGTIGGGCVEAEVKARALAALKNQTPEIASFTLNGDFGWGDGLICGGRMQIAVEPVCQGDQLTYFQRFLDLIKTGQGATEVFVVNGNTTPSMLLFDESHQTVARLREDDGADVRSISADLRSLDERPRAYSSKVAKYVPVFPRCRLIVVGCGHVGVAVAQLAAELEFDVCAIDDRNEFASKERIPRASEIIVGPIEYVLPNLEIDHSCYCLIVTRGHKQDEKALYYLINRGARYIGLIGSRRKINLIFEDLMEKGISEEVLSEVHAPVGIDIGSQSVAEISISIAAELVAHRNNAGRVPGRPEPVRAIVN